MPKVSVILPVYNTESFVAEAIESILQQTFRDYELIIVDDGSTDKTSTILESYRRSDDRIRVFRNQSNKGLSASRNIGIQKSMGEFIALMDADDISIPERFEDQVAYLEQNDDCSLVGSRVIKIDPSGKIIGAWKLPLRDHIIRWHIIYRTSRIFCNPTVMMKRQLFEKIGIYNEDIFFYEDLELWTRLFSHPDQKMSNLRKFLLFYRVHPKSITSSKSNEQEIGGQNIRAKLLSAFIGKNVTSKAVEAYEKHCDLERNEIIEIIRVWFFSYNKFVSEMKVGVLDRFTIYREILSRTVGYVDIRQQYSKVSLHDFSNILPLKDRFAIAIISLYAKARNPRA